MLKRQKQVTVRFTEEEYHQLKNKCDAAGMKMEPFLRALVSGCTIRERPPDSYKALAAQVAAVGNNLNQLTRLANSTGKIENSTLTAQRRALYRGKSKTPLPIIRSKYRRSQPASESCGGRLPPVLTLRWTARWCRIRCKGRRIGGKTRPVKEYIAAPIDFSFFLI